MVGFGSSLRLARRPGWEEAYLDYEALKLLLTQIEAVYEEEAHLQQRRREGLDLDVMFMNNAAAAAGIRHHYYHYSSTGAAAAGGDATTIDRNNSNTAAAAAAAETAPVVRDYRDELFLESDSDAAFESLMKYDYYSAEEAASDLEQQQQQQLELEQVMQLQQPSPSNNNNMMVFGSNINNNGNKNNNSNVSHAHSIFSERDSHHQHHPQQRRSDMTTSSTFSLGTAISHTAQDHHPTTSTAAATTASSTTATGRKFYQQHNHRQNVDFGGYGGVAEGYEVHYGRDDDDDDDEDDDDSQYGQTNCVPASWGVGRSKTKPLKSNNKTKPKKNNTATSLPFRGGSGRGGSQFLSPTVGESEFFVTTVGTGSSNDAFILDANADDALNDDDNADEVYSYNYNSTQAQPPQSQLTSFSQTQQQHYDYHSSNNNNADSILQKPFRRTTVSNETTALLSVPTTPGGGSSLYSFATGPVTPPQTDHFTFSTTAGRGSRSLQMPAIAGNPSTVATTTTNNNSKNNSNSHGTKAQLLKQLEEERKQERRKRRQKRRQRANKRKALEKKVPPHIRIAHTKARDITERFLGLLRAECEKVMLFAQSRLGELADTVGALRFPAMEDQQQYNTATAAGSSHNHHHEAPLSPNSGSVRTPGSYDYPLSDGGMHSASSSSDDGALDSAGLFYWSDSSSDSARSHDSGSPNIPRSLSAFRDMQEAGRPHQHKSSSFNSKHHGHHQRGRSSKNVKQPNKRYNGFDSAKRHLDHFEKLRRNRPIFQRSGHIMGEDLLLLSAVDESDGYTAVGVELKHVLKFICVNLIAVRKICRKHDRLLMNRMLGGYYHHLKMLAAVESNSRWAGGRNVADSTIKSNRNCPHQRFQDEHVQNAQTLGGLLARESGDIFETHHPAVIGQVNNYRLVGLYDANLQQLANSRTVQVISSCLVLALSEYEVSRSRAKALSGLPVPRRGSGTRAVVGHRQQQQQQQDQAYTMAGKTASMGPLDEKDEDNEMDSDDDCGAISTASSISLTRLRFTVTSIIALREAARRKKDMYTTYLSRSMLAFTGRTVVGEGLDGCSRDTLDFLVSYNPDAALLMDPASLNDGLKQGNWSKLSISSVMASCLAWSTSPAALPHELALKSIRKQEKMVMNAVNIYPKVNFIEVPELFKGPPRAKKSNTAVAILENDCFRSILRLNRASLLIYTMNYFVVHPTTITVVRGIGSPGSFSALVIGAPNCAALVAALLHCYVLSGDVRAPLSNLKSLRWLFLCAALLGMVGNAVHVYGIWVQSIFYVFFGRFIMGFSCSEILHRNIVASFLPVNRVVTETAILVQMQVLGLFLGLSVGTLAEFLPYHLTGWGIRSLSSSSWLLSTFWFIHFLFVCACFKVDDGDAAERIEANNTAEVEQILTRYNPSHSHSALDHSDSSASGHGRGNDSSIRRTSLQQTYGAKDEHGSEADEKAVDKPNNKKKRGSRKRRMRTIKTFPSRLRRLVTYSVGIPLCLFINLYIKFATEVLFSSCPMILIRYFRWGSGRAGILLAFLTLTVLPMNFICSHVARKYEERTVIKKSLLVLTIGLLVILNYSSVVKLAWQVRDLWNETEEKQWESKYDWLLGIVQYFVGFTLTFFSLTALNSSTLSLLSKVSPPRIRSTSVSLQLGTICTFVSLFAALLADMQILLIGLSRRLINTDLVNSLVLPLLVVSIVIAHFVRKHYFFLI